ncbi:hypothetical protein [Halorussus sp. AFM4]|uniref:hypothetical protein n=1 Tax=Halorussus sp. AFM4 TaxID=3421651 RepID=UPI003EBD4C33
MTILEGATRWGDGDPTTVQDAAVTCPNCGETVFAQTIGDVTCDACDETFYASDHRSEPCSAVECGDCGEAISFVQEHRCTIGEWEAYHCHHCSKNIAIETDDGPQPPERLLQTDWVLTGQPPGDVGINVTDGVWMTRPRTTREEFATEVLNIEAKANDSSFNAYIPGETNAHLCFNEEYCIGYITWNYDSEQPELGQLYILPTFREQGIGSAFVEAWRDDVAGSDARFNVNNPNSNMFRLLRSIGVIEVTEEGPEFRGCDITGHWFDVPDEWKERSPNTD